jgi:hypothetical protein
MWKYTSIAAALAIAFGAFQTVRLHSEQNAHKTDLATIRAEAATSALMAVQATDDYRKRIEAAQTDLTAAKGKIRDQAQLISTRSANIGKLRDQLAAALANPSAAVAGSPISQINPECRAILTEGGSLLEEGRKLLSEAARDSDERTAEVTALIAAWPKNQSH